MNIIVNDQPITLSTSMTVQQLLEHVQRPQSGTALAINQTIIPRSEWNSHQINDGDIILLFQAIAGG
ncbi:C-terminally thiocarboxylated form is intermediate sulfur donor in thiazole formation; part of ThiF/ThiS complex; complexes with ThiG also [Xenorhabdus bovienii str. Jollieti]|uniref:C-terminally thiocarboxylated form is intermediate sulfur donor in thiazole formation part of ThiF/ThiS complex complexes with ThiG also n=1 Tax=Xenorhabdus bovienii (strain SS-2004) TaxID=406818 RepID=D3V664_XENBS|nr:sulfur carrier protein ThiS [Xenorhabdus bovienii]CBJ83143.1 C-terminally thiocarboxylated form is intermediate sulfur donor in thiazole formation; part of ThiF/ThiS complex; complexes with ThiG also [Xenorhabdus bovienii SS-2004]CDH28866.1 C-terminally thiocarboxylated form is intermediate sulfur donor in thiazole formation; part of ThiF/ThiS complex; complexes with ThiG also [Xenorhabdus bovienii str. Jollieti]